MPKSGVNMEVPPRRKNKPERATNPKRNLIVQKLRLKLFATLDVKHCMQKFCKDIEVCMGYKASKVDEKHPSFPEGNPNLWVDL